ncbi:hypothetical protein U91I_03442 [alpha proteobacterium U9-1i]|nr:hypothetical protein U91I_03442 [alpha proteobacterium U9-1i]
MRVIDYDDIDTWTPWFDEIMAALASADLVDLLVAANPKYTNDAERLVVNAVGRKQLIPGLSAALEPFRVRVYHGTRVSADDAASIRAKGLQPLVLAERRSELVAILQRHPGWGEVSHRFDAALHDYGEKAKAGTRQDDRIHFCFSREGLLRGCNHYLCYGAEVDGHIAHDLFGDDSANALFAEHRRPLLVSWTAPYVEAEAAANPFGFDHDGMPSFMSCLLSAWAYQKAHPAYTIRQERDGVAGWFHGAIAADRLERVETLNDADLAP